MYCSKRDISNATLHSTNNIDDDNGEPHEEIFWLFRISFMYYSVIGFIVMMVVSQIVSLLTGGASQRIDEELLTPLFQSRAYKEQMHKMRTTIAMAKENNDRIVVEMTNHLKTNSFNNNNEENAHDDNNGYNGDNNTPTIIEEEKQEEEQEKEEQKTLLSANAEDKTLLQ